MFALLATTCWAAKRPREIVARHLRETMLSLAAMDGDRVVAYARVEATRPRDILWLFDVVVDAERRGQGLGSQLIERPLAHPVLADAARIFLDTRDRMRFYSRFGFDELKRSDRNGGRSLMLRERVLAPGSKKWRRARRRTSQAAGEVSHLPPPAPVRSCLHRHHHGLGDAPCYQVAGPAANLRLSGLHERDERLGDGLAEVFHEIRM